MCPELLYNENDYIKAVEAIRGKTNHVPSIGLILGSGLGVIAEQIDNADIIAYSEIPGFPQSSAPSHKGRLVLGELEGRVVVVMQGRVHLYEGYTAEQISFPVRVMKMLGVQQLVVTNASGGINHNYSVGDLVLIKDHINMLGMTGSDPLRGPNIDSFGPRFTDMSHAYDESMMLQAEAVAKEQNIKLHRGVYAYIAGPSFETPAEIRMLHVLGADAVGMSTVPEVIVAKHVGMSVLGIAAITNMSIYENNSSYETTEEEVWESLEIIIPQMLKIVKSLLSRLKVDQVVPV